jgi:hypothetical protein
MLTKTIEYTTFTGEKVSEEFHFNLTRTEITMMEMSTAGGLANTIKKMIATVDKEQLIKLWEKIILKAYGEIAPDGKRFVKSLEISEAFSQTPAYDILFMELLENADEATAFINGIVPQFDK